MYAGLEAAAVQWLETGLGSLLLSRARECFWLRGCYGRSVAGALPVRCRASVYRVRERVDALVKLTAVQGPEVARGPVCLPLV